MAVIIRAIPGTKPVELELLVSKGDERYEPTEGALYERETIAVDELREKIVAALKDAD